MNSFAPLLPSISAVKSGTVQRKCGCGSAAKCECDKEKEKTGTVQRRASGTGKSTPSSNSVSTPISSGIHSAAQGGGQVLPAGVRRQMESGFGRDLSSVHVHNDARAHQLADSLQAHAFTTGNHIFFGANQYQPSSKEGQHLLAHELTHVVQQSHSGAAVQPRLELGAVDTPAEREADRVADSIVRGFSASPAVGVSSTVVQRAARGQRDTVLAGVPPGTPASQALANNGTAVILPENKPFLLPAEKAESEDDFTWLLNLYRAAARNRRLRTTHAGRAKGEGFGSRPLWSIWRSMRPDPQGAELEKSLHSKCSPDHILELQVGGADTASNMRLLSQDRNEKAGREIWSQQVRPILDSFGLDRQMDWVEFTAVEKRGSVAPANTKVRGRKSNDPECMGQDPVPEPGGGKSVMSISGDYTPLYFVAGGAPGLIGYDRDGDVPSVFQFAVAGAQMRKVKPQGDHHIIHSGISPRIRKFPVQGPKTFDFQTSGPQPKAGGNGPELTIVTTPPGTVRLDFPFMSTAFLTPRVEQGQWRASGDFVSTKPVLRGAPVHLEVADEEMRGGIKLDPAALKRALPIPGLTIDPVSLEIGLANGDWTATGGFGFHYGKLAKGSVEASFANGVQAKGAFDLLIPGIDAAHGEVWIHEGRFGGELRIGKKNLTFPFVKSADLLIAVKDGELSGLGTVILAIPGLKDAALQFMANSNGEVGFTGRTSGSITGVKNLMVEFGYATNIGIFAKGHGSIGIPGMDAVALDVNYVNGVLTGGLEAKYSKGRLQGLLKVWLTPAHKIGGHGELSYEIVPGLPVLVGLDVNEDGSTKFSAGFQLPDPLVLPFFKQPLEVNHDIIPTRHFSIPLFGFPGVDLEAVGNFGLAADAGIGPAVITGGKILSEFDPSKDGQEMGFIAEGTLEIPAHAGVNLIVNGGLGLRVLIAKAEGTLGFTVGAELCGKVMAATRLQYVNGKFSIDACACLLASPCVSVHGTAGVRVYLDLLIHDVDLYGPKTWDLGGFDWGSDFTIGLVFPFHYAFGDSFMLAENQVRFIHPDISLGKILQDMLPA